MRRGLAALPAAWLLAFLAVPTGLLAARGLSADGLRLLSDGSAWTLLGRSFGVAALTTVLCLAAAYPVAWFIATSPPKRRAALLLLVVLPFWTNQLVRTYSLMVVLRPLGLLHTPAAIILGLVHSFLPFMVLPLATAIERIPPRMLEAAADLGATPAQVFRRVAFPLSMPGVGAGCLLVFLPAVGIFALPEFLGGARLPLVGNQINLLFKQDPVSPPGSALTLVLMVLTAALTALYLRARKTEGLS